jgi:hypothetical protein
MKPAPPVTKTGEFNDIDSHRVDRDWQFITAVHLCPAGQSRHQNMNTSLGPQRHQIILVEQCRARPDKT